ncbi:MAG: phosphoribosylglycinamide formyltransferase [Gammaproteobacteria bacterium]|nr:phosphoribosylglycinamide formyltransferase [Gammaproteobacteria bacterium]NIR84263.1 phosphoribosylglycinamide formyltransferase [Gammaproteobacteria bacterium]NIR89733.1 phosphoribosylglycinamide formyltransferase [Gammaproteobacteria bacterium]NIU05421.1 phosphoribosylglycinamide formyltransferase [Gammaproteobacteria bacterium]NIV52367.1 phosphoribosylglycinamide formyltransferase [Gammaproteobacteria bacterium]
MSGKPLPIVVLVSGRGTNLQSIIDAIAAGEVPAAIRAVISNEAGAPALERARRAGIATEAVAHRDFPDREGFERALLHVVEGYAPQLIVLAGFMRILTRTFVDRYRGRIMNIHPSLLPRFPGLDTHRRALEAGVSEHGATVHFVTGELDAGPIIAQARVPVYPGDTPERLAARVLEHEHRILPRAIRWFAEGRLELRGDTVLLDGRPALEALDESPT